MTNFSSHKPTVWVVDDSPTDLTHAARTLSADYAVATFAEGAAVIERLSHERGPDVLVLDLVMPGLSGLELCHFLRSSSAAHEALPILLITAARDPDQVVAGLSAGANDFVAKPYSEAELRARVASLLRTRQLIERSERAEATVRELLSKAPDALLAVDQAGVITYANEQASRAFQAPAAALVGRPVRELLPDLGRERLAAALDEPTPLPDVVVHGRSFAPTVRGLDPRDRGGMTVALRDVTESRRKEARRLDFYAMVAHDLRSPLGAMLLRTNMINRGKFGVLPPGLLADVRKMEGTIQSLVGMINEFLDLARLEAAGLKMDRSEVDLSNVVEDSIEDLRPLAEARRLDLAAATAPAAVVLGDRRRLGQVIENLLSNAIKFTPPGGAVSVDLRCSDTFVEVAVQDNGAGIPPEAIPTLFDRFTRAQNAERTSLGSGLGLMIVREIVEAHGGRVWVESQLGEGSTFFVRLPRPPREAGTGRERGAEHRQGGSRALSAPA